MKPESAQISPNKWRIVRAISKSTGEIREYGCYESWGKLYWTADNGETWWKSRKEARNVAQ